MSYSELDLTTYYRSLTVLESYFSTPDNESVTVSLRAFLENAAPEDVVSLVHYVIAEVGE